MKTKVDLLHGSIVKGLLLFALPILISNIFQQLYNTVDTMVVGRFLGDTSLAAIGACTAIYDLLVGFALGIGNGLSLVTARSYGRGDEELLKKSVAASIVIGGGISLLVSVVGALALCPLLTLLHTPAEIMAESYSYISLITAFVVVMFAYNLLAGLLKAIGDSTMAVVFLVVASAINIVLDIFFISRCGMGIRGAALATVIAQGISALLCLVYILKKCKILVPAKRHFAFDKQLYTDMLGQGLSMGLMSSIVSAGSVILQGSINKLGTLVIAGHTAARRAFAFSTMPVSTIAMALATFVSQNRGADNGARIRKGVKTAHILSVAAGAAIALLLLCFAPALVKLISSSSEPIVLENGALYLRISGPFFMVLGILMNTRFALQGIGRKIIPLVSSVIEFLGKVVFSLLIIPHTGYMGVIFCEPVIWCIMCLQLLYTFYKDPYITACKYAPGAD